MSTRIDRANAVRALSMDAVQAANSGHPGAPMGLADVAEVFWRTVLKHNPRDPGWIDRDRFILSNGHGSMLLYSVLHLSGYDVSMSDIRAFRQLHSPTAGHPEYGECPGVETTTGPLGQGIANAVGMALAETRLASHFNRHGHQIIDHRTWVMLGDGCLMEGISHEAASLAGTLGLGKLVAIYDDNGISIDGEVSQWFTEDIPARFGAYGWRVIRDVDGHDGEEVTAAFAEVLAADRDSRPTLICCKTTIGFGAPNKQGSAAAHGAALGDDEINATRKALNWGFPPFEIPARIYEEWDCTGRGSELQDDWNQRMAAYAEAFPELAAELSRRMKGELRADWYVPIRALARQAQADMRPLATRKASQRCLTALAQGLPELFGGSADLTSSNLTRWEGATDAQHMSFGVREFAMTAITNGMALHGGFRPFSATFLVFMEYARNAVRLAALMGAPNVFVYTHDSVAVGEDGPTHQPIEQLTNLRTTPGLSTWRPCDTVESAVAWEAAIAAESRPSALIFTRQDTAPQPRDEQTFANICRGGYVLLAEPRQLDALIIATGSEVELAVKAAGILSDQGIGVRVISMPCTDVFLAQERAYQDAVIPPKMRSRVVVEAGHPDYWYRFAGLDGRVVGIDRFGLSAPGSQAMAELEITVDRVVSAVRELV